MLLPLISLDINNYRIDDIGIEYISNLKLLTNLNIDDCNQITNIGIKHISKLKLLKSLNINDCHKITGVGIKYLSKLKLLEILNISFYSCYSDYYINSQYIVFECICELLMLHTLTIKNFSKIYDDDFKSILKISTLTELNIYNFYKITDISFEYISKLKILNIYKMGIKNLSNLLPLTIINTNI